MFGKLLVIPNRSIKTYTPLPSHRSLDLYATAGSRFEGRVNDNLSDVVNVEHIVAGLFRKLLIVVIPGLLICGSSYKVDLLRKVNASRDDGSSLIVEVEELNDSLIDLLLDPAEVILKSTNERACRF